MKKLRWVAGLVSVGFMACGGAGYVATQPAGEAPALEVRPRPASARFTVGGKPVQVHALPTGTIQIKTCHHGNCLSESAPYPLRFLSILADRTFVEPMPIWTYAIAHPEGVWVVDTGADAAWMDPESWECDPQSGRVAHSMARVDTRPEEEVVARLEAVGIGREQVRGAIITHMHFDHTAGVKPLGAKTYVGQGDLDAAREIGATPCRFVEGAELEAVEPLVGRARVADGAPGDRPGGSVVRGGHDVHARRSGRG